MKAYFLRFSELTTDFIHRMIIVGTSAKLLIKFLIELFKSNKNTVKSTIRVDLALITVLRKF